MVEHVRRRGAAAKPASRSGETRFDWNDRTTWAPALDGVTAAYLVDSESPEAPEQVGAFARLAVDRGVSRLVLLSARDWAVSGGEPALATERALRESGAAWTILRPTWFVQNFAEAFLLQPILDGRIAQATGDGQDPFIDAEDIAEVAAVALTEDGHEGQIYELSGPRLISWRDIVREIAEATGRDIAYVPVSKEEFVANAVAGGLPEEVANVFVTLHGWIAEGRNEHLSDGVRRVLGREPRDVGEYIKETAATGVWNPEANR
ncbi:uncharacterized protein YbjT (DUF2867 family) [Herbihabitans rhizosphaerae]|uniref:Uncharacterized protein YbjT (DUF2867 family) n=1 Tax=Herbihabitans rhizosphaerae TaxID=1872711 RepID=A0A4Q7KW88_9PSEU|nr:uncharacterized protein YbjT (DUF2867 family) [Herbihabitans rhizosphaerae]